QYHYFQYYIYDEKGTACVSAYGSGGSRNGNEVVGVRVDSFPRRAGKFIVKVQEQGNGGQEMSEKFFTIHNPAKKSYSSLTAESLPATKTDDDLAVTLTKLVAGMQGPYNRSDTDPEDAINKGVAATFHVERNGKPVNNWLPVSVETSDATGNRVNGWSPIFNNGNGNNQQTDWANGDGTMTYQYGLWPDEPWKIKLEFSQQSDFTDSELWNVPNVPFVPAKQNEMYNFPNRRQTATNAPFAETDLNGFHLKLFPAKNFTDAGNNDWMQGGLFLQVTPDVTTGYRMTIKVTDNQTNDVQCSQYNNQRMNNVANYSYRLQDIAGLTNINVSISLHKSRYVEFTAKPELAPKSDNAQ
ncbi:MAG TPA: hypothetical protein VN516_03615, partial [Candidatus Baltobacteraceae bacterium]|nr:hypothetical protein [Candidatus Baltobacteraceae bacterium]